MKHITFYLLMIFTVFIITACQKQLTKTNETPEPVVTAPEETKNKDKDATSDARETISIVFSDINFAYDRSEILPDFKKKLNEYSVYLNQNPSVRIQIEGHCDERGTIEYNIALGDKRATTVRNYLMGQGISSARIDTISFGKEKPLDQGRSEDAWSKNRRAAFNVEEE